MRKVLMETAQQPDIDYIIVTDNKGNIIADSDPSMVGQKYGLDLDSAIIALSKEIKWRQVTNPRRRGHFRSLPRFFSSGANTPKTNFHPRAKLKA